MPDLIHPHDPLPEDCTQVGLFAATTLEDAGAGGVVSSPGPLTGRLFLVENKSEWDQAFFDNGITICNYEETDPDGIKAGRKLRLRIKHEERVLKKTIYTEFAAGNPGVVFNDGVNDYYHGPLIETPVTVNIWSNEIGPGTCYPYPTPPPTKPWRIRRFKFEGDYFTHVVSITGVTTIASGLANTAPPHQIDIFSMSFAPLQLTPGITNGGVTGYRFVYEVQKDNGDWPDDPVEPIDISHPCETT